MVRLSQSARERLGLSSQDLRDPFLRRFQRIFDEVAFDIRWPLVGAGFDSRHAKTEHIGNHIGKALGKVLSLEHDRPGSRDTVRIEAFPDTLMYRTQLANTLRYDLKRRLGTVATDSTSLIEVDDLLTEARAAIDTFDERMDHGVYVPAYLQKVRTVAIPALHFAGLTMANIFDIDPREAHASRLIRNLRRSTTLID